jgi:hypothetical protein
MQAPFSHFVNGSDAFTEPLQKKSITFNQPQTCMRSALQKGTDIGTVSSSAKFPFCEETNLQSELFIVPNATKIGRFAQVRMGFYRVAGDHEVRNF